jgi:hypothetical protein
LLSNTFATEQKTEPRSSSVSLSPEVKVQDMLHINDYTKAKMAACWYGLEEYKEMKKEIKYIVGLIENKEFIDKE